jgi:Zn-dependent M32 family carboxypeptidase
MKTIYCLQVDETDQELVGEAAEFIDKYWQNHQEDFEDAYDEIFDDIYHLGSIYVFPNEQELMAARTDAKKFGLPVDIIYRFEIEPHEWETVPAFYVTPSLHFVPLAMT